MGFLELLAGMSGTVLFILVLLYFLPTFIAVFRRHPDAAAIAVLNFFLGVSFVGWVIALVWALISFGKREGAIIIQGVRVGQQGAEGGVIQGGTKEPRKGKSEDSALEILRKKFVNGEISEEEYLEKKNVLEGKFEEEKEEVIVKPKKEIKLKFELPINPKTPKWFFILTPVLNLLIFIPFLLAVLDSEVNKFGVKLAASSLVLRNVLPFVFIIGGLFVLGSIILTVIFLMEKKEDEVFIPPIALLTIIVLLLISYNYPEVTIPFVVSVLIILYIAFITIYCGFQLLKNRYKCPKCGAEVDSDDVFCQICGKKLKKVKKEEKKKTSLKLLFLATRTFINKLVEGKTRKQ